MKTLLKMLAISVIAGALCSQAMAADTVLDGWGFNVNGTIYDSTTGSLPSIFDTSGFDFNTGLGTILVDFKTIGSSSILAFLDHEIGQAANTFFNEYGVEHGTASSGQSWEIDEPGYVYGDIYDNFLAGALDDSNGVPSTAPDDVSMALGWDFLVGADQEALLSFTVGTTAPATGLYLEQTDPDSDASIYYSSTLKVEDLSPPVNAVPEPGTVVLMASGVVLGLIRWAGKRR